MNRSVLAAPVALAAAGALAFAPAVVAPAPVLGAAPVTVVHVEDIQLAGIGQDIYYAITPVVQYAVGGVSYLVNFIPLVGGPIAAQININYFQLVQPVIEATVNYAAAVVQNPLNFIGATAAYGSTLYDIGYNWVSAEAVFFGLPPLPPLPQSAATVGRPDRGNPANSPDRGTPAREAAVPGSAAAVGADRARAADRPARAVPRQRTALKAVASVAEDQGAEDQGSKPRKTRPKR